MIYLIMILLVISSIYALDNTDNEDLSENVFIFNILIGGGLLFLTVGYDINSMWLLIYCVPTIMYIISIFIDFRSEKHNDEDNKEFEKYYTSQLTEYCNKNGNTVPKYIYDAVYHFFKHKNFINYDLKSVVSFINKYSVFKPDSEILIAIRAYDTAIKRAAQLIGE
jgi:hypothetical protein